MGSDWIEQVQLASIEAFDSYTYYFIPEPYLPDTTFGYDSTIVLTDEFDGGISHVGGCCNVETWIYLQATDSSGCSGKRQYYGNT